MKITYIGHSTFLIKDKDFNILTDPFPWFFRMGHIAVILAVLFALRGVKL